MARKLNTTPVYSQLNSILRDRILSGEFETGAKFLTERSIAKEYGVSRTTANKSLSSLVSEGLLDFRKGVGTFVLGEAEIDEVGNPVGFTQNALRRNRVPSTIVTKFEKRPVRELSEIERIDELELNPDDEVYVVERIRCADDEPMLIENRVLVAELLPGLTAARLEASLYSLIESDYGFEIEGTDEKIDAVVIDGREAELLNLEGSNAGFLITAIGFIEPGRPLWLESTLHKPDGFEFRCRTNHVPRHRDRSQRVLVSRTFS